MKILIVNFNLKDISIEDYKNEICLKGAINFTKVPGLISKHYLEDDKTNNLWRCICF